MAKNSLTKSLTILTLTKTAFHRGIKLVGLPGLRGLNVYVKMFIDNTDVVTVILILSGVCPLCETDGISIHRNGFCRISCRYRFWCWIAIQKAYSAGLSSSEPLQGFLFCKFCLAFRVAGTTVFDVERVRTFQIYNYFFGKNLGDFVSFRMHPNTN